VTNPSLALNGVTCPEGVFFYVGTKILRLLLHAIHSHLRQLIFLLHPYGFLGLEISTAIAESRWGLALYTLSLSLPLIVTLFFLFLHFIYIQRHFFL
jgi:hypothetical protein